MTDAQGNTTALAGDRKAAHKRAALMIMAALVGVLVGGELIARGIAKTTLEPACARYGAVQGLTPSGYKLSIKKSSRNRKGSRHYCLFRDSAGEERKVPIAKLGWQWHLLSLPLSPMINSAILAALVVLYWYKILRPKRPGDA